MCRTANRQLAKATAEIIRQITVAGYRICVNSDLRRMLTIGDRGKWGEVQRAGDDTELFACCVFHSDSTRNTPDKNVSLAFVPGFADRIR
jgi:hypothetical protein